MSNADPERLDEAVDPFAIVAAGMSVAFLVAGVVWPHMAGSMLRGLVLTLGLLYVGRRLRAAEFPSTRLLDEWTPFDNATEPRRPSVPTELQEIEHELRFADDPVRSRRAVVQGSVRRIVGKARGRPLAEETSIHALDDILDELETL